MAHQADSARVGMHVVAFARPRPEWEQRHTPDIVSCPDAAHPRTLAELTELTPEMQRTMEDSRQHLLACEAPRLPG
jgi:hypothetical protein